MSLRKGQFTKILLATLLLIVFIPIGMLFSSLIFQWHMHPDEWGYIWQDIPTIGIVVVAYVLYIYKVIWRKEDELENS